MPKLMKALTMMILISLTNSLFYKMENSKHTPGPWKIEGNKILNVRNNPDKELLVCEVYDDTFNLNFEANIKLIAAAPDLLETLTTIVGFMKNSGLTTHHYKSYFESAKAAIKKATE